MDFAQIVDALWPVWEQDPVAYADDALGRHLWSKQAEVVRAVYAHPRVAVRSGHKTGKSAGAASLGLAFASLRPSSRVIVTAPTNRQVDEVIWREVVHLYRHARLPLGGRLYETPQKGWRGPNGSQLIGFSTDDPDKFSGFSGADSLIIVDEAAGVKKQIFEAISGVLASGGKLLLLGNPTQQSGEFYDAFHSKRGSYQRFHIPSTSVPNVTGAEPSIRGLATPDWCASQLADYGSATHPIYQVRVLGDFPIEGSDVVISIGLIERARAAYAHTPPSGRLHLGVDVARYGDDMSVIVARRGLRVVAIDAFAKHGTIEVANRVLGLAKQLALPGEKPVVKVDEINVGAGVVDQLYEAQAGGAPVEVYGVNVASAADDDDKYHNLRAQVHFAVADWIRDGGAFEDDRLEAELVVAKFKFDARGRIQIEKKDEIKERLGRSPDRADALALAVYDGGWSPRAVKIRGL